MLQCILSTGNKYLNSQTITENNRLQAVYCALATEKVRENSFSLNFK